MNISQKDEYKTLLVLSPKKIHTMPYRALEPKDLIFVYNNQKVEENKFQSWLKSTRSSVIMFLCGR